MTVHSVTIGDYDVKYDDSQNVKITVDAASYGQQYYGPIPSKEECNAAFGTSNLDLDLSYTFKGCDRMLAAPELPDDVYCVGSAAFGCFDDCSSLIIPPKLPKNIIQQGNYNCYFVFSDCSMLVQPAVIPLSAYDVGLMYARDSILKMPASIPPNVRRMESIYAVCTELEGEFCIKAATLSRYVRALKDTVKPITIYGDRSVCEAVAATANNGNASWSAWYEPETPVTNRGQGSRTTAEDMTRMVRNGALAVPSYAPGRMVYHRGDFVREDEWGALVAAAQTIDPTVTASTRYDNLNKIEAAFGSAL